MDKLINKAEGIIEKATKDFEEKPLSTAIKALLLIYLAKKVVNLVKEAKK